MIPWVVCVVLRVTIQILSNTFCCDQHIRHWPWILCVLGEISIFWTMIPWVVCASGKGAAGPSTKDSRGRTSYPVSGSSSTYCALQLSYEVHCRNAQHIIILSTYLCIAIVRTHKFCTVTNINCTIAKVDHHQLCVQLFVFDPMHVVAGPE